MAKSRLWRSLALVLTGAAAGLGLAACDTTVDAQPGYGPYGPPPGPQPYGYGSPGAYGYDQGYADDQGYDSPEVVAYAPPPPLPIYEQPPIPGYGYIWTPGYWAWNPAVGDYYWIPGTWVQPPQIGLLWTPGFWQWRGTSFGFIGGYWGPTVGFYGGVNYGFGYDGDGYEGGRWRGDRFFYNRRVNNITNTITTVYDQNVIQRNTYVSYNGGGGVLARPTPEQMAARRGPHLSPTVEQVQNVHAAMARPDLRAAVNQGRPTIVATPRPGVFAGPGVVTNARAVAPYDARSVARPPVSRDPTSPRQDRGLNPAFVSRPPVAGQSPEAGAPPPRAYARPYPDGQGFQPRGESARPQPVQPQPQFDRFREQAPRFQNPRVMTPGYPEGAGAPPPNRGQGFPPPRSFNSPPEAPRFAPPPRSFSPPPMRAPAPPPEARPQPQARPAPPPRQSAPAPARADPRQNGPDRKPND